MTRFCLMASAIAIGLMAACGAKPSFQGWVYSNGSVRYRVGELPPRWTRVDVEHGQVNFFDASTGATILSQARCRLTDAPLRALTGHLLIGMTDRRLVSQTPLEIAGRAALRTRVDARLDGVGVALEIVVLKKDGCNFDFVYTAPPARFEARRADFEAFVAGFVKVRTRETPGAAR